MRSSAFVIALFTGAVSADLQTAVTNAHNIAQDIAIHQSITLASHQSGAEQKLEKLDNYLDTLNEQVRENMKNDINVTKEWVQQSLSRYQDIIYKATVKDAVNKAAW
jgi:hypothetical protein